MAGEAPSGVNELLVIKDFEVNNQVQANCLSSK